MFLPFYLNRDPEPPARRSGGPRYSLFAALSVLLNIPWIVCLLAFCWEQATSIRPHPGWLFLPLFAWLFAGFPGALLGFVGFVQIHYSRGKMRGRWIAILGMLMALSAVLALAFGLN